MPDVRDDRVSLPGVALRYLEYTGSGRSIVLLHGVASNALIWGLVAPLLSERHHVFAVDQRGHGQSDTPDDGYDFATVVADTAAFVDAHSLDRPVIVGHSWGGNVALQYAATHPDRIAGLVMVDGGFMEISARPGATWERAEKEMAPPELTHLRPEQLIEGAKRWELGKIWSGDVEAALMGNFALTEEGTIRPHLSRANHMQVVRALWEQKPSQLYGDVRCPALFIAAERAGEGRAKEWLEMKREAIARAEDLLPRAQVRWFADTIHDIPLQRPRELADEIVAFAASLDA